MKRGHIIAHSIFVLILLGAVATCKLLGLITFFVPYWLLGLLALPFVIWIAATGMSGLPSRTNAVSVTFRAVLTLLVILCLADTQVVLKNDGLCVFFLLDHSASIPESIVDQELEYVNGAAETKRRKDTAGIVVFGENASVEVMPVKDLKLDRVYSYVEKGHTDLQTAVELATAAFPSDTRKKIVLITDGNENKGRLTEGIKLAAGNEVAFDVLPVGYAYRNEVLVEKIHIPDKVKENETFDLKVHVASLQACPGTLSIYRNDTIVARKEVDLKKGRNSYDVALKIKEPGFYVFTARITTEHDTIPENNEASNYVYIQGASRILFVAPTELEVRYLAQVCREENIETDIVMPESLTQSIGTLQDYDCVVLANVAAENLSEKQMTMLQASVRDLGMGLIMLGGEDSFGSGDYEGTPIEEALPVSMDIKQKKINPKGALVLVLHTCEFANGNYWAKQIAKRAIDTVNSQDEVGILIYGNGEEWLFPLRPAEDKRFMFGKIDKCMPGDMPSFEPTMQMALEGLGKSDAMVKHMIVISDGDPARPQPGLVQDIADAGITISTVAINPHSPRDVDVMKYLAHKTGGRYYFVSDPSALPKIFTKEAKVVKRSLIFNQKFQPLLTLSTEVTKGIDPDDVPPLMAYVATTPKPRALVPIVSDNENHDPVLAYWRYGLGRAAAFTSDATSNWGKNWVRWGKYKKFWTQIIRWTARKREKSDLRIHTEMDGVKGKLVIDAIDQQGKYINFLKLNGRLVDPENVGSVLNIRQTSPGRYEAEFEASKVGVNIANIGYKNPETGGQGFVATGISVPYSPEYKQLKSNVRLLQHAINAAGGRELRGDPRVDKVFAANLMPPGKSFQPIWEYLLIAALVVFFMDVIIRRVIISREDIVSAWTSFRASMAEKKKAGQDKTMAALLKRKEKTFEKVKPKADAETSPADSGFKESLEKRAATQQEKLELDTAGEKGRAAPTTQPGAAKKDPALSKAGDDEDSYTGRLLAAKRRAKKQKSEEEE